MAYINGQEVLFSPSVSCTNPAMAKIIDRSIQELTERDFEGVEKIGMAAFSNCTELKSVSFSDDITVIGYNAFGSCLELEKVIFNEGCKITLFEPYAFQNTTKLKSIELPKSLTAINMEVFKWSGLMNIVIPDNLKRIANNVFNGCEALSWVRFEGTPEVLYSAFTNCASLTDIYVPWAEGEVANAPWGATNATIHYNYIEPTVGLAYTLSSDGTYYACNGIGTATDTDIVIACHIDSLPVSSIAKSAFVENTDITSVIIPDTVKTINYKAFFKCSNLKAIEMSSVTKITANACNQCDLQELILGSGITFSGGHHFGKNNNLKSVKFLGTPVTTTDNIFADCDALSDIFVPWSEGEVANAPWGATNATIHYNSEV